MRLLNSTPLGEIANTQIVQKHLNRAGFRIGDGRHIDLVRYAAWLLTQNELRGGRTGSNPMNSGIQSQYESHKEAMAARSRKLSESARDIANGEWIHKPVDPARRQEALGSFRRFCEIYFPETFKLAWSEDHLKVISKIEQAVVHGGLFAMAMPRGSGKTSLCETGCLWAILNGSREFVCLIGADEEHAAEMLESIKSEMENNDLLEEDFSEVCGPIRAMEGVHQRASAQLYLGERTHIGWTAKEIILPTLPALPWLDGKPPATNGAVIKVAGITGRIRGMKVKRPDGVALRPSLVLIDDPQTDESAKSKSQSEERERILSGAILGLAGPGRKIAGLMTLTVVFPGDMADRMLDRQKHPQWQGERTKMVYSFPTNEKLWTEYARLRAEGQRSDGGVKLANEFYRKNRAAMDAGAKVAWAERFNPDEISALQHAMNLKLDRGEPAFFAEYQNEPIGDQSETDGELTTGAILAKVSGLPRGIVPATAQYLTAFIDIQQKMLYWLVAAWNDDFTGHIVDYGAWPDQKRSYFTLRDARRTLAVAYPKAGLQGAIHQGLADLTQSLMKKAWQRDGGQEFHIDRCYIDANWGESTEVVYSFCRQSDHASVLMPYHGRGIGASGTPMSDLARKAGDRFGLHWRIPGNRGNRPIRHIDSDTNFWKSFIAGRLLMATGDPGSLTIFGKRPDDHRLLADQLTSERRVTTEARGRSVDEWKIKGPGLDNHWFDCLTGCAVAASVLGATPSGVVGKPARRPKIRLSDIQKRKKGFI